MEIRLKRIFKGAVGREYSIGRLTINGVYFCDTLEDLDRGLSKTMPVYDIRRKKVPGKTAIPAGRYAVTMKVQSPKFSQPKYARQYGFCKGFLPRLLGVPCFDGVLIHAGSNASHTDGCVLVGKNTIKGALTESTATFMKLYAVLEAADRRRENIYITIE